MRSLIFAAVFMMLTGVAHAAGMTVIVNGEAYRIGIPGDTSNCRLTDDGGICSYKDEFVVVGPEGCGDSFGAGYCGRSALKDLVGVTANELSCADGRFFMIGTGKSPARCRADSSGKYCVSLDGVSTIAASCDTGCMDSTGSGSCRIGQGARPGPLEES